MLPIRKIIILAILAVTLGLGGFLTGRILSGLDVSNLASSNHLKTLISDTGSGYKVITPVNAPIMRTVPVLLRKKRSPYDVLLDQDEAAEIETGQTVILYTMDGEAQAASGTVADVSPGADRKGRMRVTLSIPPEAWPDKAKKLKARIAVMDGFIMKQIPLSALQTDEDSRQTYIWKAVHGEDGQVRAVRQAQALGITGDGVFAVDYPVSVGDLILQHPDQHLKDGQIINIKDGDFNPPALHPLEAARQRENEEYAAKVRLERKKEREEKYGFSCDAVVDEQGIPLELNGQLPPPAAAPENGSYACGAAGAGSSAGCASSPPGKCGDCSAGEGTAKSVPAAE